MVPHARLRRSHDYRDNAGDKEKRYFVSQGGCDSATLDEEIESKEHSRESRDGELPADGEQEKDQGCAVPSRGRHPASAIAEVSEERRESERRGDQILAARDPGHGLDVSRVGDEKCGGGESDWAADVLPEDDPARR